MKEVFNKAKEEHEMIPIPEELNDVVQAGIQQGRAAYRRHTTRRRSILSTAACLALLVTALNTSPTIAKAAAELPGVGGLFQIFTFRQYTDTNDDRTVEVNQPSVTGSDFTAKIDAEIQRYVDEKLAEGEKVVAEAKAAFLATGGTEEEWAARNTTVSVDYEIKSRTDTAVSFVVSSYVTVATAYQEQVYYNLDVANDRELTLADLLGEDWVELCNDAIRTEISTAEDPSVYFVQDMGGFTTVDESTAFYINAAGNPVVVFPRATIAINSLGVVEFEIPIVSKSADRETMSLEALLGADYTNYVMETITMQMGNRMDKNPEIRYFPIVENVPLSDYVTIDEHTRFGLDASGNPVILIPAGVVTDAEHCEQSFRIPR